MGEIVRWVAITSTLCMLCLTSPVHANDFPTQARVEYVLGCMDSHGGQKYENLYSCVCIIDKIADKIAYGEYIEGEVFTQLRTTPGERGGLFRDPERARLLVKKITNITEVAEKAGFVGLRTNTANKENERG